LTPSRFAGTTSGLVVFYSTTESAQHITAAMLGIDPGSVTGELPDAIGELTNMIAGSFRTRMAHGRGEAWAPLGAHGHHRFGFLHQIREQRAPGLFQVARQIVA
jgi:hypothetical protein